MFGMYFDWTWLIIIPGMLLALWAQTRVTSTFNKYSQVKASNHMQAHDIAARLLSAHGAGNVQIERIAGSLTDHYDPSSNTLRLSQSVYDSDSIAAIGVAAHESGHAFQHAEGYKWMGLRTAIVPAVNIGSTLSWPIFLVGLIMSYPLLLNIGIILFAATVLFSLVTLPVEINASARAISFLESDNYLTSEEIVGAKAVLQAAALTYVASALNAILQLVRLLILRNNRRS